MAIQLAFPSAAGLPEKVLANKRMIARSLKRKVVTPARFEVSHKKQKKAKVRQSVLLFVCTYVSYGVHP